jgi:hypothetical protein
MGYFVNILNNEIASKTQCFTTAKDLICYESTEKIWNDLEKYIWNGSKLVKNPNYNAEQLEKAKNKKYLEALAKAKDFIENGALFQFDENNHIEATDGNIGKFTAYAVGFSSKQFNSVYWTTKEDNVIELNAEDVQTILVGLGSIQSDVWNVQFVAYKTAIDNASTVEEVERITINYVN